MTGFGAAAARAVAGVAAVVRRLIGAPDYERYVLHAQANEHRVMSQREFTDSQLATRYDKPGSRCC